MAEQVKVEVLAEDKTGSIFEGISGKFAKFGLAIGGVQQAFSLLTGPANDVAKFNKLIAQAASQVAGGAKTMADFKRVAVDAARGTSFSAENAAEALKQLAGGTITADEAMAVLGDTVKFATATGMEDLNQAVLAVSNVMTLFKLEGEDTKDAMDLLTRANQVTFGTIDQLIDAFQQAAPAAAQAGMSMQETTAILSLLADAGFLGAEGGVAIKRALEQLALSDTQEKLGELGVKVKDASGEFVGLTNVLEQLEEKTKSMTGFERQAFLAEIFGQLAGPRMAALLSMGSEALKERIDSLADHNGAMQKANDVMAQAKNPLDELNQLWFEFELTIAPAVNQGIKLIIMSIQGWKAIFDLFIHDLTTIVMPQLTALKDFLWDLSGRVIQGVIDRVNGLVNAFKGLVSAAGNVASSVGQGISSAAGKVGGLLGFQSGGIVPGPLGAPQLAVVHGGERVTPASGLSSSLSGGIVINISGNTIASEMDLDNIARRVGDELVRSLKLNLRVG